MKILYISDSTIPSYSANSIHVMKMCHAFANNGNDVTLIGKHTTASLKHVKDTYSFYDVGRTFRIKRFPSISFPGSGRLFNILLPFFIFRRHDLAYTRAIYPAFWYSLLGKPICFEIHEPFDTKSGFLKWMFKYIVRKKSIQKWIVISGALRHYLATNHGIEQSKITVAHDAADPFPLQITPVRLEGKFRIGYVGSLLQGKGMEIIAPLSKMMPDVTFHIVGGNDNIIAYWKAQSGSNVFFHGYRPHSDTKSFIKSFHVLIAPYLDRVFVKRQSNSNNIAQWMSPLKIFEYMSSGIPIVTSDLPVLKEVLHHNENAWLCNPADVNDWANAITSIKSNPALGTQIATRAQSDFLACYTWEKRAQLILHNIAR